MSERTGQRKKRDQGGRVLRRLGLAVVVLSGLAVANSVLTGHDLASVPALIATFAVAWIVFFGGARVLAVWHLGRAQIALVVAALLPAVLLASIASGSFAPPEAVVVFVTAALLFAGTFGLVYRLLATQSSG